MKMKIVVSAIAVLLVVFATFVSAYEIRSFISSKTKPAAKTLNDLYPGNLANVNAIEITDGSSGKRVTITDSVTVREWVNQAKDMEFVLDPNQEARTGYLFSVSLNEGPTRKLAFTPNSLGGHYYIYNEALATQIRLLFEKGDDDAQVLKPAPSGCRLILGPDLLENAKQGRLTGVKPALYTTKSELEKTFGKTGEPGFNQTEFAKYDNCYFYIWEGGQIGVIDVKIDDSPEKVKETLGKPDFEGNPDAGFDEYMLGYKAGDYYLYFKYSNKASTTGVLRFKKP